jgi:phosphoserine phosphatase
LTVAAEIVFDENGKFVRMQYPDQDAQLKVTQIKEIAAKHAVATEDIVCIGDGANERELFKLTRGITFENSKASDIAWNVVPDLRAILGVLGL